ncbi:MAG: D-glycerate dehydrogenase [Verrucomicrobiales bacterium]|nr:D-glycerate dehydrogenase [Verrucomicrobiales bacterium]
MAQPKILVTLNVPREHLAPLDGLAELIISDHEPHPMPRAEVLEKIGTCDGLISQGELRVDEELLAVAPKLKIVANAAMGTDNLDLPALSARGIQATNTPAAFIQSTADLTFGLILSVTRRIAEGDRFVRTGEWGKLGMQPLRWESPLLRGKNLGLIGYGKIAKEVEKRAEAFGLQVLHTRTSNPENHPNFRELDALLGESQIVVALVPHTQSTDRLMNAERFAKMQPGSYFINVARGKVMDEAALVDALAGGHLAGAGLDVFEEEPVVNPALFAMENVLMTPHVGGATFEERAAGRLEAAENVACFLKGESIPSPVN